MSLTWIRRVACVTTLLLPGVLHAQREPRREVQSTTRAAARNACAAWVRALNERGAVALPQEPAIQVPCDPPDSTIVRLWRTVGADSAQLFELAGLTASLGGARLLREVLRTVRDRRRPVLVRVAAIAVIGPYMEPSDACWHRRLDTLSSEPGCWVDHPSYRASSSIEPVLRDSIRATLRVAAAERGAVRRAAASLLPDWRMPERWSEARAASCRRSAAAFAPALRMNAAILASDELRTLAECTESGPAALSLAWRSAPADTTLLTQLVRISAEVRDRRLYAALLAVARDSSRPTPVRVAAVDAIASLLHPALYWFQTSRAVANRGNSCSAWGFFSHEAVQEEGAEPMGLGSRRAGVTELSRLAREDVPPAVREAALTVSRCAERLLERHAPEMW